MFKDSLLKTNRYGMMGQIGNERGVCESEVGSAIPDFLNSVDENVKPRTFKVKHHQRNTAPCYLAVSSLPAFPPQDAGTHDWSN